MSRVLDVIKDDLRVVVHKYARRVRYILAYRAMAKL